MRLSPRELEDRVAAALERRAIAGAGEIAWACAWLEACGYPGLAMLAEALAEPPPVPDLARDTLGIDLASRSCAYLAPRVMAEVEVGGRAFLRNVRHGLYLLPFSVRGNLAIGCPIDSSFAVGGERLRNPYAEKLAFAAANGMELDDALMRRVEG